MTNQLVIGIICFALMVVLTMAGVPVCISLLFPATLGFLLVGGVPMMAKQLADGVFANSASYSYAVVPLFTIVGVLAGDTGIAGNAYTSMHAWLSKRKGGLVYATICANAVFGACSGISVAGNIVFSKIAAPELKKRHYDESLSYGCISAASALSSLIPPSIPIIMTCILTETSIGTSLMCSTAAGILVVILMCLVVKITGLIHPEKLPSPSEEDKQITWLDRLKSLRLLIPIAVLFALIIGGSFFGWFPATVGGAIAMVAIVIYALCKKMPVKHIGKSLWQGVTMFVGIFLMILGGTLFSRFVTTTGLASVMVSGIAKLTLPPIIIFLIVVVFYLFIGCFMNTMPIIIITAPIIVPMLKGIGFSEFVVVVALVLLTEIGNITPPVGNGVFMVATALKESPAKIFKGIWPFFFALVGAVILFAIFPITLEWLPRLLGMM